MRKKRDKIIYSIFILVVFLGLFIFWQVIHPLYIYDTDDWTYITQSRSAIPLWKTWNPSRVLPETIMPLISELGVYIIYPFSNDFFGSMASFTALFLSLIVLIYLLAFVNYIGKKHLMSGGMMGAMLIIITLLHFLPFTVNKINNQHMFYASSVTCIFYYTIPCLLNGILVLYFHSKDDIWEFNKNNTTKNALLIFLVYLAIFSNMFQSIILASYAASIIFSKIILLIRNKKYKNYKKEFLNKEIIPWISILIVWLIALAFDYSGGRSASVKTILHFKSSINTYFKVFESLNKLFVFFVIINFIIAGIYIMGTESWNIRNAANRIIKSLSANLVIIFAFILTSIFLILLCSITGVSYLKESSVFFSVIFFVLIIALDCFGYLLCNKFILRLMIPILVYILMFETIFSTKTFRPYNQSLYMEKDVKAIDEMILRQIMNTNSNLNSDVEVFVPVTNLGCDDNFPISVKYGGDRIAESLKKLGFISNQLHITLSADYAINNQLGLE